MTIQRPPLHSYKVIYGSPGDPTTFLQDDVLAAYFQHDGDDGMFTTFKNATHEAVYSIRNDWLISVERDV